jgi:hypothetical protein
MKNKKIKYSYHLILLLLGFAVFAALGFVGDDVTGEKRVNSPIYKSANTSVGGKFGESYRLNINNINLPMNRTGVIADVNIPDDNPQIAGAGGKFGGHIFLFSSGFFLSGLSNGNLWANAVASASLVRDYLPGTVARSNDPNAVMYVVKASDEPFGQSWLDWADAVDLGADFYDGDGDGVYDPVDRNGNGIWDPDEDMPDLLGDVTVWCVYHDGAPAAQRRWNQVDPLGIEVRQSVFAFASSGAIGNIIFLRYRIKYVGLGGANEPDKLDDCYFGVWADPDLGDHNDDLVGCDVSRNAAYTYNDGSDASYGSQPPAYFIDFFSGPLEYIPGVTFVDNNGNGIFDDGDEPLDTAYSIGGQIMGVKEYPGARNQPLSSVVEYLNGFSVEFNDPDNHLQARNYMLGLMRGGGEVDPCTLPIGAVRGGVDCNTVDPRFWFSGDPVTDIGWIGTQPWDVRQMSNTGPFTLFKDEEKEIVVAYVVGQGSDAKDAITVTRAIDDGAQTIFNNNFLAPSPPPAPVVAISTNEEFIDLVWETPTQVNYVNQAETYNIRFGGYNVYAYKTFNTAQFINNQPNSTLVTRYRINDFVNNIFKENGQTGGIELLYPAVSEANKLSASIYSDPDRGRIRMRITEDPFTGGPLIKGKPYYFAVTSFGINYDALVKIGPGNFGDFSDYYLSAQSFVQEVENVFDIRPIVFGRDIYSPPSLPVTGTLTVGPSNGKLQYDIIDKRDLTGDRYKVTFAIDSSTPKYSTFWKLENTTKQTLVRDSAKTYLYDKNDVNDIVTDGFIVRLSEEVPQIASKPKYELQQMWIDTATSVYHYLTDDINQSSKLLNIGGNLATYSGTFVKADRLRRVEIRFGQTQKAYRYLNGYFGNTTAQKTRFFKYAESINSAIAENDQTLLNGQWDAANDRAIGYVDVPFQVWVADSAVGEMKQMAIGFVEKKTAYGGKPDGIWDPGTNLLTTGEYIFIFDAPYDPDGNQVIYKGGPYIHPSATYADLNGAAVSNGAFYNIPPDANISELERKIGRSSFFNTLYAVGIFKSSPEAAFSNGDKIIIDVNNYAYSELDEFEFQTRKEGALSFDEEKSLFDKVNVFPNPLFGYNIATSYTNSPADEPFVTFTNLPNEEITIKIYSLSGSLLRTMTKAAGSTSPFLNWNLKNESGLRAASGLYLAIVSSPSYGDKVLKFSIIMPQKQLPRY